MADGYKNFAYGTVATAPSPASTGLTLVLVAGQGTDFPTAPFNVTVWPAGVQPRSSNAERARVVTVSTDTLTFEDAGGGARAPQEGSSARSIVAGDQIAYTWGKKEVDDVYTAIAGAGFQVGSSALVCDIVADPTYPMDGSINVGWSQITLAGADINIDGGDPSIINFVTSGWYGWGFSCVFASVPAALTSLGTQWNIPADSSQQTQTSRQVGMNFQQINAIALPFKVTAPAAFSILVYGRPFTAGDVGDLADGYLCVTRFS